MTDCATVFMFTFHRQTEIGGIEPVSVGYTSVSVSVSVSVSLVLLLQGSVDEMPEIFKEEVS